MDEIQQIEFVPFLAIFVSVCISYPPRVKIIAWKVVIETFCVCFSHRRDSEVDTGPHPKVATNRKPASKVMTSPEPLPEVATHPELDSEVDALTR